MPEFNPGDMGGTMRLGSRRTKFVVSPLVKDYLDNSEVAKMTNRLSCVSVSGSEEDGSEDIAANVSTENESDKENFPDYLSCFNSYRLMNADHIEARHRHR